MYITLYKTNNFRYGMLPPRKNQPSGNLWSAQCNHTQQTPTSVFNKKFQFDLEVAPYEQEYELRMTYALSRAPYIQ